MTDLHWLQQEVEAEGKSLKIEIPLSIGWTKAQMNALAWGMTRDACRDYGPFDRMTTCTDRLKNVLEIVLEK